MILHYDIHTTEQTAKTFKMSVVDGSPMYAQTGWINNKGKAIFFK